MPSPLFYHLIEATLSTVGNVAEEIVNYAIEQKSSLIVFGMQYRSFSGSRFIGKTAEPVIRYAPAFVLLIP